MAGPVEPTGGPRPTAVLALLDRVRHLLHPAPTLAMRRPPRAPSHRPVRRADPEARAWPPSPSSTPTPSSRGADQGPLPHAVVPPSPSRPTDTASPHSGCGRRPGHRQPGARPPRRLAGGMTSPRTTAPRDPRAPFPTSAPPSRARAATDSRPSSPSTPRGPPLATVARTAGFRPPPGRPRPPVGVFATRSSSVGSRRAPRLVAARPDAALDPRAGTGVAAYLALTATVLSAWLRHPWRARFRRPPAAGILWTHVDLGRRHRGAWWRGHVAALALDRYAGVGWTGVFVPWGVAHKRPTPVALGTVALYGLALVVATAGPGRVHRPGRCGSPSTRPPCSSSVCHWPTASPPGATAPPSAGCTPRPVWRSPVLQFTRWAERHARRGRPGPRGPMTRAPDLLVGVTPGSIGPVEPAAPVRIGRLGPGRTRPAGPPPATGGTEALRAGHRRPLGSGAAAARRRPGARALLRRQRRLDGRGGAGFPLGRKVETARLGPGGVPSSIVNASESEPVSAGGPHPVSAPAAPGARRGRPRWPGRSVSTRSCSTPTGARLPVRAARPGRRRTGAGRRARPRVAPVRRVPTGTSPGSPRPSRRLRRPGGPPDRASPEPTRWPSVAPAAGPRSWPTPRRSPSCRRRRPSGGGGLACLRNAPGAPSSPDCARSRWPVAAPRHRARGLGTHGPGHRGRPPGTRGRAAGGAGRRSGRRVRRDLGPAVTRPGRPRSTRESLALRGGLARMWPARCPPARRLPPGRDRPDRPLPGRRIGRPVRLLRRRACPGWPTAWTGPAAGTTRRRSIGPSCPRLAHDSVSPVVPAPTLTGSSRLVALDARGLRRRRRAPSGRWPVPGLGPPPGAGRARGRMAMTVTVRIDPTRCRGTPLRPVLRRRRTRPLGIRPGGGRATSIRRSGRKARGRRRRAPTGPSSSRPSTPPNSGRSPSTPDGYGPLRPGVTAWSTRLGRTGRTAGALRRRPLSPPLTLSPRRRGAPMGKLVGIVALVS